MQVRLLRFGSIEVDGREYDNDIIIEGGRVRNRRRSRRSHTAMGSDILLCRLTRCSPGAEAG
jgi:hypothetical protein